MNARAPLAVLQEASDAVADWTCDASTECCRFKVTGREPSVTRAEWEVVWRAFRATGRRLQVQRPSDGACPFLSEAGRCVVYEARPLGCRTFFCHRAQGPSPVDKKHMRALASELNALGRTDADAARPLMSWVAEASRKRG